MSWQLQNEVHNLSCDPRVSPLLISHTPCPTVLYFCLILLLPPQGWPITLTVTFFPEKFLFIPHGPTAYPHLLGLLLFFLP